MKKFLAALAIALCLGTPSFAESLYWIGQSPHGIECYLDKDSVKKDDSTHAAAWVKCFNPDGSYSLSQFSVDRNNHKYALLANYVYDASGKVTYSSVPDQLKWEPIEPETMMYRLCHGIWGD